MVGIYPHVMLLAYLVGDLKDDIYEKNKDQSIGLNEGEECYWGALVQKFQKNRQ